MMTPHPWAEFLKPVIRGDFGSESLTYSPGEESIVRTFRRTYRIWSRFVERAFFGFVLLLNCVVSEVDRVFLMGSLRNKSPPVTDL